MKVFILLKNLLLLLFQADGLYSKIRESEEQKI